MNEELVTIATFTTPNEAAVARVALEAVGIKAFVANDPRAYDAPSGDAIAGRAWRAAIFGLVVCWGFDWPLPMSHPLLGLAMTFYSVALLISLAVTSVPLSDRARWCNLGAWVFNALATLAIGSVVGVFAAIANR